MSKTLKFTKPQLKVLFRCYVLGTEQTLTNDNHMIDNGFVKEKVINREHKIMNNVSKKLAKAMK